MIINNKQIDFSDLTNFRVPRRNLSKLAPKAYGKINPAEHLALKKDHNKAELTILSRDGVAVGKALVQLMAQGETLADVDEVIINAASTADLQFITNYLVCPPGQEFAQRFQGTKLTIRLHNFKAALQLPTLITTTGMGENADEACSILPELFRKDVTYEIVETTQMNQAKLLKQLQRTRKELESRKELPLQIKENITKTLQKIEEYITSDKLVFINKKERFEAKTIRSQRAYANALYVQEILAGKTFYVQTDEITHLKLLDNTLYIIDTGNPSTVAYVKALLKKDPDCIKNIVIMQTHFHNDHCARLPELLAFIRKNKINAQLVFNKKLHHQFAGFFATNLRVFKNNPTLHFLPISEDRTTRVSKKTTFSLFNKVPHLLRHFIQSNGYFLQQGSRGEFFTGDINPPTPDKINGEDLATVSVKALHTYLTTILEQALAKKIKTLNIFADIGHFAGIATLMNGFSAILEEVEKELKKKYRKKYNLKVQLLSEHKKATRNYVTAIHAPPK